MRRALICVLIVLMLVCAVSCKKQDYVCYYGYFTDTAFCLIYSNIKNTLYYVNIPIDTIVAWGQEEGFDSVPAVIRDFSELKESGFMLGTPQTFQACKDIFDAMSQKRNPKAEDRLQCIADRAGDFTREPLLTNINRLCSANVLALASAMNSKHPSVSVLDASVVIKNDNLQFSKTNFNSWIKQVIR